MVSIRVNGCRKEVHASDYGEFAEELRVGDKELILNGYAKRREIWCDIPVSEGDECFFIGNGELPELSLLDRIIASRNAKGFYERLKKSEVAVLGLGGLGSNVAIHLARMGVGKLLLLDADVVDITNLNRQQYRVSDIGRKKTEALSEYLRESAPLVSLSISDTWLEESNIGKLIGGCPVVAECFDGVESKRLVFDYALEHPEMTLAASSGMAGLGSGNEIKTAKFGKNIYVSGDQTSDVSDGIGLMAPRVALCAAHQANVIMRILLGFDGI